MPRIPEGLGAGLEQALGDVNVPAYVIDPEGILVWLNPALQGLVGDARGRRFTEVVAPPDRARARARFAQKILGTASVTDFDVAVVRPDGTEARIEVSSVPLRAGHMIVGVFGLISRPPQPSPTASSPHPMLTPREVEVLRLLAQGASTDQIAEMLHIARETVRNHVRSILRKLGVHSRLEAIAVARSEGVLDD